MLLGARRWRCEMCRCNFVSLRPRKMRYVRPSDRLVPDGASDAHSRPVWRRTAANAMDRTWMTSSKMRKARPAWADRALKEKWFQVTLVHSLLSSRHARLERGALVLPPHVRFAPRSAICTLRFNAW